MTVNLIYLKVKTLIMYILRTIQVGMYLFANDVAVKLEFCEVICMEQGCLKHFSNVGCLKEHMKSSHSYITCEICGTNQLKKNIKRHLRSHEEGTGSLPEIQCSFEDCKATFSNVSSYPQII